MVEGVPNFRRRAMVREKGLEKRTNDLQKNPADALFSTAAKLPQTVFRIGPSGNYNEVFKLLFAGGNVHYPVRATDRRGTRRNAPANTGLIVIAINQSEVRRCDLAGADQRRAQDNSDGKFARLHAWEIGPLG